MNRNECAKLIKEKISEEYDGLSSAISYERKESASRIACFSFDLGVQYGCNIGKEIANSVLTDD